MEPILQVETIMHCFGTRIDAEDAREDEASLVGATPDGHASISIVFPWQGGWAYLVEL